MYTRRWLVLVAPAALFLGSGCAENKLTRQNYDMIKEGLSNKDEVRMTLGDNYAAHSEDRWEYEDDKSHLSVVIHFDERGKVLAKEWRDARTGEWEGQAPGIDPNPPGRKAAERRSTTTIDR